MLLIAEIPITFKTDSVTVFKKKITKKTFAIFNFLN